MANRKRTFLLGLSLAWKVLGGIVVAAGIIGTVLGIYSVVVSHISVDSSDTPLNPSDIFSTPFKAKNEGNLPLKDVEFKCFERSIIDANNENRVEDDFEDTYSPEESGGQIGIGKQVDIFCIPWSPLGYGRIETTS